MRAICRARRLHDARRFEVRFLCVLGASVFDVISAVDSRITKDATSNVNAASASVSVAMLSACSDELTPLPAHAEPPQDARFEHLAEGELRAGAVGVRQLQPCRGDDRHFRRHAQGA